jgi:hypothetical protein
MLPLSLKVIGNSFGVSSKDLFPILFPNLVSLDYSNKVPAFKYFSNKITKPEYKKYCEEFKGKK